jgi:hypothetical protein
VGSELGREDDKHVKRYILATLPEPPGGGASGAIRERDWMADLSRSYPHKTSRQRPDLEAFVLEAMIFPTKRPHADLKTT